MKTRISLFFFSLISFSLLANIDKGQKQQGENAVDDDLIIIPKQENQSKYTYKPMMLKLNESGDQYVRFIVWHQQWLTTNNLNDGDAKLQLTSAVRRSRFLAYAQLHPRVLILTHWGLNGLTPNNLTSLGSNGDAPQLFLHDAWTEFKVSEALFIGTGLHYWKGLTRLASQSTLNFMGMDQARPFVAWHSLGISDQFARHLGVYAKGNLGKVNYRVAFNNPGFNPLGAGASFGDLETQLQYTGVSNEDKSGQQVGNTIIEGYFSYSFFEKESIKLPYWVGAYLGTKKVFNLGIGFFSHAKGMYHTATGEHQDVFHVAADAFLDLPTNKGAFTAYASWVNFNYGENYMSRWAGTGTNFLAQMGYFFKSANIMPYINYQIGNYEGLNNNLTAMDLGLNYFIMEHHAKLSFDYHMINNFAAEGGRDLSGNPIGMSQFRMQAHIFF